MKTYQRFSFVWAVMTVLVILAGMFLSATANLVGNANIGKVFLLGGSVSMAIYASLNLFLFFKNGSGTLLKNLISVYLILSLFLIFGGLVLAILTYANGFTYFIVGLGMMIVFWLGVLIRFLLKKES